MGTGGAVHGHTGFLDMGFITLILTIHRGVRIQGSSVPFLSSFHTSCPQEWGLDLCLTLYAGL